MLYNNLKRTLLALAVACALAPFLRGALAAAAHHGWADYDRSKTVEMSGEIVESRYENPHCEAKVRAGDGAVWVLELSAPWRMQNRGVKPEMIKPGTQITASGHPHKRKANDMKATRVTLDGKTYDLR